MNRTSYPLAPVAQVVVKNLTPREIGSETKA
jgi:hypothetical protein